MNEEIDESEFYHQDFTTASEWEIFIARIEETIQEWKNEDRNTTEPTLNQWYIKTENIPFADIEFILTWYQRKSDDINKAIEENKHPIKEFYDFQHEKETLDFPIASWYGLDELIILKARDSNEITSESRIKVLLSSLHIVASSVNCNTPIFVQIRKEWQKCYLGVYENEGIRTNFEMVHLRRGPQHCQYLSGLLDLFKTKIMSPISLDPIVVSVRLTYTLNDFGKSTWRQEIFDSECEDFSSITCCMLPFGVTIDPIKSILFRAIWSCLPDNLVVDTENYTDFDPLQAPRWTISANMVDQALCLLSDCLLEFTQILGSNSTVYDILGDFAVIPTPEVNNPLDVLTESKVPTISSVLKRAARNSLTKNRRGIAPLSEDVLVPMLYFLFPDADENAEFPYAEFVKKTTDSVEDNSNIENLCRGYKTCAPDSLVWRLAIVLAQALHTLGGNRAFAHLWYEFSQEMRYRWEKSIMIPGVEPGSPNQRTCLLHQKLQMLNCCIERKKARDSGMSSSSYDTAEGSSDDDDVFFDCCDKVEDDNPKKKVKHSLWNQPVGRLSKFEDMKLLKTGEPLYIPTTQDPGPKTEDQLQEDTDVMLKLGSDAQGSELRAKMMSASLLSDMESFKAANPGAILEDFIRWYSPRDWIIEEGEDEWGQPKGRLSSRMLISDNTWVQVWESAKPVPAHRQKRLFDDTREAEKVLHFLDSRNVAQIAELLLPTLAHAAIYKLAEEREQVDQELPDTITSLRQLIKSAETLSREGTVSQRRFEACAQKVAALELRISQVNSLMYKLNPSGEADPEVSKAVVALVNDGEVAFEGRDSKIGKRVFAMFSEAQNSANMIVAEQGSNENAAFPRATEREFVMRASAVRPAAYSAKCPQFLRAILSKNEFRLVGAFSEDITFF